MTVQEVFGSGGDSPWDRPIIGRVQANSLRAAALFGRGSARTAADQADREPRATMSTWISPTPAKSPRLRGSKNRTRLGHAALGGAALPRVLAHCMCNCTAGAEVARPFAIQPRRRHLALHLDGEGPGYNRCAV
jgi:hypothetical protein